MSKSKSLDEPISSAEHIHSEAVKLMHDLKCPPMDVRGLGIQMTRLEIMSQNASSSASRQRSLKTMLSEMQQKSSTAKSKTTAVVDVPPSLASPSTLSSPSGNLFPPPDSQIDPEAWKNLPDEIRLEYADARSALVQQRRMLKGKGKATEPFSDTIDDENNIINNYNSSFEIHNFQDTVDNQDDGGFGITSSQLDMETLGELPEEFQRQVLADVSRRRGSTSTAATSVTAATVAAAVIKEKDTRAIMPTTLDDLDMSAFEQMPKNIQQDVMQQMGGKDGGHGGKTTDGVNVTPSKRKRVAFDNISPRLESEDYNPDSITFSQIDSSVLDALPPEIRSEVTRNVKRNVIKAKTATASKKSPLKPSPSGVRRIDHIFSNNDNNGNPAPQLSYSSSSIDGRIIPLITGPPLFNNELISFELVEQAVGDWVRSCMSSDGTTFISPPLSDDKDAISSYIADLEQAMFFTEAAVLVSKLSRLLSTVMDVDTGGTTFKPLWREFIDSLLANKNYLH